MRHIVVTVTTLLALSVLAVGCGSSTSSPNTQHSTASSAAKPPVRTSAFPHSCASNICTVPLFVDGDETDAKAPTATQLASLCYNGWISSITPIAAYAGDNFAGTTSELIVICEERSE